MLWGVGTLEEEIARVQALRADPPALAKTGKRRKTFGYSLQQFAELLTASSRSEASSSPITLFYALSQAGRAIAAAGCRGPGTRYEFHGHGLKITAAATVGETVVRPELNGSDAFSVVADSTQSATLDSEVTVSELWGSLPQFQPAPGLGDASPPVRLLEADPMAGLGKRHHAAALRLTAADDARGLANVLIDYPLATGSELCGGPILSTTPGYTDKIYVVQWLAAGRPVPLAEVHETFFGDETFYLRPRLGQQQELPSILMTTWALLLALSSVARYQPVMWSQALDLDSSAIAIPLRYTISRLQMTIPRLVLHALSESWNV
jgi:hypothetical protein